MALGGVYTTGTLTIAGDRVTVTGVGTLWATQLSAGDWLLIAGQVGLIQAVSDNTHMLLQSQWQGTLPSAATYVAIKMSWLRYDPALTQAKLRELLAAIAEQGTFIFTDISPPDPAVGQDGDWALRTDTQPWQVWFKTGGVWVAQKPPGFTWRGAWSSATAYVPNDAVERLGSSYISKTNNTNQAPEANADDWDLMAASGSTAIGPSSVEASMLNADNSAERLVFRDRLNFVSRAGDAMTGDLTINSTYLIQNSATDYAPQHQMWHEGNTAGSAAYQNFQRSRVGTTAVLNGDALGTIVWNGLQNGAFRTGAIVSANVAAAPAGNFVPTFLTFGIDGGSGLTDTLRLRGGAVQVLPNTTSTSPTTGALTVAGGVGIGDNLTIGGQILTINSPSNTQLSILNNAAGNGWIWWLDHGSADTFMLSIATASAWGGNVLTVTRAGQFNILQNIASTSPTTGALTVAGGVGVNGEIHTGALRAGTYPKGVTASPLQIGYDNATNYGLTIRPATDTSPFAEVFFNAGGSIVGSITTTGAATAYNTTSDERGKPNREPLSPDLARGIVDALEVYDFDKDGNAIRGIGLIAQQAHGVHKSLASPGQTSADWWMAEKAAPMPFVIVNMQQINQRLDALERRLAV